MNIADLCIRNRSIEKRVDESAISFCRTSIHTRIADVVIASQGELNMKMMLLFLTALFVGGSHNQTVSRTAQDDPKLAAILDRISNTSPQGKEIVEKIKDLKPEVNGRPSAMTLGATVKDHSESARIYKPFGWEASQKMNGRWKIILHYQHVREQYKEAEWEFDPATNKLYPFEAQNAPQFWAPGCQPLDSTDPDQLWVRMNECLRPEGVKRTGKPSLSPSRDRYIIVGDYWERRETNGRPIPGTWTDLWLVNINGTGLQRLTTNGTSRDPEWSPDGNEILFVDKGSIKILDTRSNEVRTIREGSADSESGNDPNFVVYDQPKWSVNGKAIAILARDKHSAKVEVLTANGREVCHFAKGAAHHQWNKEGELVLDYGKFSFDWESILFSPDAQPPPEEKHVKAVSEEAADRLRNTLLKRVSSYGVIEIGDYSVAPSGNRIVFAGKFEGSTLAREASDLWLANLDGTGLRRLTENHYSSHPAWSPSGKEIAFVDSYSIGIINVKTGRRRSLPGLQAGLPPGGTETSADASVYRDARWSLNGKVIAAIGGNGGMVWVTAVEARSGREIFQSTTETADSFTWNKDGELVVGQIGKFVFDWDRTFWYGRREQITFNDDASAVADPLLNKLLERVSMKGVKNISEYVLSPSSERLVFVGEFADTWSFVDPALEGMPRTRTDLWLINRDGTGLRRLTTDGMSSDPAWSPSGNEIAFADEGSIKIMNLRTGAVRGLRGLRGHRGHAHDYTEYSGPEWSPNGKAILAGTRSEAPQTAVADIVSGNRFFFSQVWYGGIAWNDDSELLFDREGTNAPFKVMFDWERIRGRGPASVRLFPFKQDGKFGYFDSNENWEAAIKPQFSNAGYFSEGLAPVAIDGKWGYINKAGELMNIPRFDAAHPFSRGVARVKLDGRWRLIDKRSLGDIGPAKSAITALIPALKHRHDSVRIFAAKTLAQMSPSALATLVEALKGENESVRTAAAKIIGEIGSKAEPAIPALVTALKGEDESASSNAAQALSQIGPPAVPALIEALKNPRDYVRRHAARALMTLAFNDEEAIMRDDLRRNRVRALGKLEATVVPALIEALKDSDAPVRKAAAGALGVMRPQTKDAADALIAALKDPDSATRSSASQALVYVILYSSSDSPFEQTAVPALIVVLRGEDMGARDAAASILDAAGSSIGPREKEAVPALIEAVKYRDEFVRIRAFNRLALLGPDGKAALPAVIEALKDQDAGVRKAAADALGRLGPDAKMAIPALIEALDSKDQTLAPLMAGKLADISKALRDAKATDSISLLKDAYNALLKSKDPAVSSFASSVKQAIDYLESLR
ncbi:MAG: HEAT repeat domain-containing protein [Acidobacteriota bacterium]